MNQTLVIRLGFLLSGLLGAHAAPIPGLFNTGVDNAGVLLASGAVDPHYRLVQSADAAYLGPNAFVVNDAWPVAAGVWMLHGPNSKWIAPQTSQATGNQAGDYVYRLTFDLTGLDPDTAVITGRWSSDNAGVDIRVNGLSTGINYDGNFAAFSGTWTINAGFIEGTNALDFVINNASTTVNPTGFRAELSGTADLPLPPGTPPTVTVPPTSATVALQDTATFTVKATGSKPLRYQWRLNGNPIGGATNSAYTVGSVSASDAGRYDVVVSNDWGIDTSLPATLTAIFTPPAQPVYEPLGPSTRRTALVFSEIMYHPREGTGAPNLEFIELFNSDPWAEDLSGWRLTGEVEFTFPNGTSIPGLGFLVVAPAPADLQAAYGITGVLGGFTNRLDNSGGNLRLVKRSGAIVLDVTYADQPPWPIAADGTGHSLVLARPSFGERSPKAWAASAAIGGSPGAADPVPGASQDNVVINELLAHTDPPLLDFVELYNSSTLAADLSGCWLTDDPTTNKFRIPNGTTLASQEFVAFDQSELGFALSADGETVYLVNSNQTRVIDAVRFDGQATGVSYGRHPDGGPVLSLLSVPTSGTNNTPPLMSPVVINEIMFNPVSRDNDDEFLELFNRGFSDVNLGGWRLNGGIGFAFPSNTVIAAGGYLVVANNAAHLRTNYSNLTPANCIGNYGGNLANGGERITLERQETIIATNAGGGVSTNTFYVVLNEVSYFDKSRWSRFADGGGSSLELIDSHADNRLAANWADSDVSAAAPAPWTAVEFTGMVDNAMPGVNADQVQLFLLGEGEALVDDVEVVYNGANRVPNPNFESGTNGWFFQGTQIRTGWEANSGYNSAHSLHVRASDRGEPIVNRVRAPLSATIPLGSTVTLRAKVRWLAGAPEFLMRLHGGGLEATARLSVPANLGTPGTANSRALANAGPVITDLTHRPVLPPANQSIRVLARVQDPDGVAGVVLKYRLDPSLTLATLPMHDDGTGGDLVPGDGVFTATIPAQPSATMVAFHIVATDGAGSSAASTFPTDAPTRECFIRVGETLVAGPFGNYRIWLAQTTVNHWATRGNLSNDPLDVTFVYGNSRVIYNAGSLYGGSPAWSPQFTSPIGVLCAYDVLLPGDDTLIGDDKLSLDIPIRDATNQREQLMHWIADQYNLPNLRRRDVYMFVNGVRRGSVYHDTQQPDGDLLDEWFHDDPDGTLVKAAQWSEGDDAGTPSSSWGQPLLGRFTSGGTLKIAAYRWPWRLRAADSQLDYTNFLDLVETVNLTNVAYQSAVEGVVDIEDWMRMFAMNDLCSYWDALGNPNKKNTYIYKPQNATWRTIPWDFDVGLGVYNDPVDALLFPTDVDPVIQWMYNFPAFVRAYWRELEFGVNSIFPNPAITTILTAKDDAYRANGLSFTSPFVASGAYGLSVTAWINARRAFLQTQLATVAASFNVTSPTNFTTNQNSILITGTSPVGVKTLTINGVAWPVTWTTVTAWRLQVPLATGTNTINLAGLDRSGSVIASTTRTLTVDYTGLQEPPEGNVVFSEIMYRPLAAGGAYVELFNRSTNFTFDLSGWRLNGLDFTFPTGAVIAPLSHLVLAEDRVRFAQTYGTTIGVFGVFDGRLDLDGETLTLFRPGPTSGSELVVDRVRYEPSAPWPSEANGTGSSLQLVDATQRGDRPANWFSDYAAAYTNTAWRRISVTGPIGTLGRVLIYLGEPGDVYLDDLSLVTGTTAGVGFNYVRNGDFESPLYDDPALTNSWVVGTNYFTNSAISTAFKHSGSASLHMVCAFAGTALNRIIYQNLSPAPPNTTVCTLSFWYLPTSSASNLNVRIQNSSSLTTLTVVRPNYIPALVSVTPGSNNVTSGGPLPLMPPLWLNEVQAENLTGPTDAAGHRVPWIELYNAGPNPESLDGLYLANNYTNLTQWAFPSAAVLNPGEFKVIFADGATGESTADEWHTSFALAPGGGAVALSRVVDGQPQVLDYINYDAVRPDFSFGSYPDGQPFYRRAMFHTTPGGTNSAAAPPITAIINEWMASNTGFLRNPVDGNTDDWFELYNPGPFAADLGGHYLTDDLLNRAQYRVPDNGHYIIPPGGYLLVWANGKSGYNSTNQPDLFVNFNLAREGEAIGLFAPDGTLIDSVTFGPQTNNLSEGRWPEGSTNISFMPTPTPGASNAAPNPAPLWVDVPLLSEGGNVTLFWNSQAGQLYRVQYKTDLAEPQWTDLPGDVEATDSIASKTDPDALSQPQRFYRIRLIQ